VERTTIAGETEELGENLPQRHFVTSKRLFHRLIQKGPNELKGHNAKNPVQQVPVSI
jgi:hypothetical protein